MTNAPNQNLHPEFPPCSGPPLGYTLWTRESLPFWKRLLNYLGLTQYPENPWLGRNVYYEK